MAIMFSILKGQFQLMKTGNFRSPFPRSLEDMLGHKVYESGKSRAFVTR